MFASYEELVSYLSVASPDIPLLPKATFYFLLEIDLRVGPVTATINSYNKATPEPLLELHV